jgi:hypothetical protein
MAYTYEDMGRVQHFWPDDTDDTIYTRDAHSIAYIVELVQAKWPGVSLENVTITSEYINTRYITYDIYDPSDYDEFIVITKV